jgi:hypothetical protein
MDTKLLLAKLREYPRQIEVILSMYSVKLADFMDSLINEIKANGMEIDNLDAIVSFDINVGSYTDELIRLVNSSDINTVNRSAALALVFRTDKGQKLFENLPISQKAELALPWVYPMVRLAKIEKSLIPSKMISAVLSWYIKEGAATEIVDCVEICRKSVNASVFEIYTTFLEECDTNYRDGVIYHLSKVADLSDNEVSKLRNETIQ